MPDLIVQSDLTQSRKNINSQFGEDGIIEEILNRISRASMLDGWCVEFGAWDGIHLSNTCNLIQNKNYKAVLIEADVKKHKDLCKNFPSHDVIKICQFVTLDGDSTLDFILQNTPIPTNFDFLSVDIDGCDYYVFDSLKIYQPKIICIEFNPTIPNDVEFVQPKDFSIKQSASAKSLTHLATTKGYSLVATTFCNLIFVKNEFKECVIGADDLALEELRDDADCKTYIFFGYDGTVLTNKSSIVMPWHNIELDLKSLQKLPFFLRRYPPDYNLIQKISFLFILLIKFPKQFFQRILMFKERWSRRIGKIVKPG